VTASAQLLAAATDTGTGTGEAVTFWILAPVAVLAALGVLASKKAVHSALLLALTMLSLAVLYLAQDAPFLGVVQVVVYTGAVMMLFLFVLMLVGVDSADSLVETLRGQRIAAVVAALGFGGLLVFSLGDVVVTNKGLTDANQDGNVVGLADLIFSRYVFAFEVVSALLIIAARGAMVLAHRERHEARASQRDLSVQRFLGGQHPAPLPGPGVYARHNAVDTPALLPDGSPAEVSVSRVLVARGDIRRVPGAITPSSGEVVRTGEDGTP
jgi:NADH-quinone oxidoreductase subunit J